MYFGCIADDFTGASDAASFLQKGGMRVVLVNGVPRNPGKGGLAEGVDGVVIALKSRALPPGEAVDQTLLAARWLREAGAEQMYVKYCSTFDSTEKGNIGPVCDRLLEWTGQRFTLLCPSLPANGRTVKKGILYVDGTPLAESPMSRHPVNPMKKSRIRDLMESQSRYPCYETGAGCAGAAEGELPEHYYLVPDYETRKDGQTIAGKFGDLGLLTGGSGLCEALAEYHVEKRGGRERQGKQGDSNRERQENQEVSRGRQENQGGSRGWPEDGTATGREQKKLLILAGSCSAATRRQIEAWKQAGGSCLRIDPRQLLEDFSVLEQAKRRIREMEGELLVYSAPAAGGEAGEESRENRAENQAEKRPAGQAENWTAGQAEKRTAGQGESQAAGQEELSAVLDRAFSGLALYGRSCGCKRLVVAGGETSGAVTRALGYQAFYVRDSIAPGVPVLVPAEDRSMALVLKSGNFGGERFFEDAKEAIF